MTLPGYLFPLAQPQTVVVTSADDTSDILPFAELELDQATGDMKFPPNIILGGAAVAQRLQFRLQFFKGEWFLDKRVGMPYFEAILVKNPDINLISTLFRRAILATPGVLSIATFRPTYTAADRSFALNEFEAVLTGGVVFRAQPDEFVIQIPQIGA